MNTDAYGDEELMICYGTMKVTGITERNLQKCLVLSEMYFCSEIWANTNRLD